LLLQAVFGTKQERATVGSIDFQNRHVKQGDLEAVLALAPSKVWLALAETKNQAEKPKVLLKNQAEIEVERNFVHYKLMVKLQTSKNKQFVVCPPSLAQKRYFIRATMLTPGDAPSVIGDVTNQLWQWNPEGRERNSDEVGKDEKVEGGQFDLKNVFFPFWNVRFAANGVLRVEVLDITNNTGYQSIDRSIALTK